MASFSWKDPKTGKTYYGADGQARWIASMNAAPAKGTDRPGLLGPPPVGTYDPSIDYNAGASQRGYDQYAGDAQTSFEQGQQDYGLNLGDLTTSRDRNLSDIGTSRTRENENYGVSTADLVRQFGILGHQQADKAAQQGITSAGLLGKSASVRAANQAHDQSAIDLGHNRSLADLGTAETRTNEDFTSGKTRLDLGNARQFGGFNGQQILNPLTGQPEYGSLLTGLTRAGTENNAFQTASAGQRAQGAAANGYTPPVGGVSLADFLKKWKAR